jgi:hypothetical protein
MDFVNKLMPILWNIIEKNKNCSVNVTTIDNQLTVNILLGKRKKIFSHDDSNIVFHQLEKFSVA